MSSSTSSTSSVNMYAPIPAAATPVIFSLNIACAERDEKDCPLAYRLPFLIRFLQKQKAELKFNVLCIQEIRPTKWYSVADIINEIAQALKLEPIVKRTNASGNKCFVRATFYDSSIWMEKQTHVEYTTNTKSPAFSHMIMTSEFIRLPSTTMDSTFSVVNVHVPAGFDEAAKQDRLKYWERVNEIVQQSYEKPAPCIAIGDFNKFTEEYVFATLVSKCNNFDLVHQSQITFESFPNDVDKKTGEVFKSSLDGIVMTMSHVTKSDPNFRIIPTLDTFTHIKNIVTLMNDTNAGVEVHAMLHMKDENNYYKKAFAYIRNLPEFEQPNELKFLSTPMRYTDHYGINVAMTH